MWVLAMRLLVLWRVLHVDEGLAKLRGKVQRRFRHTVDARVSYRDLGAGMTGTRYRFG
jgi:hypothetical protein